MNLKVKTTKEKRVEVHSLAHNILGINMACWNFGMEIRTNDKLVNYSYGPT
jgi:hypothetical protein